VLQLAKSLAVEWVDFCRVNCVSPGYTQTQIMEYASKEMLDKWLAQIPARRFASPFELKGVRSYESLSRLDLVNIGHL
jgi:NAD(P)-dependent dehydrogenase (short-subunit alcohol dehydrogenase family)